jgi:Tfp pilus assembly protein PilX
MVTIFNRTSIKPSENVASRRLEDNRGVVLVIVLIMLLLFSILGATVLTNSTSELKVSGNYRNQQQAFFTADGGLEQGHISDAIYSIIPNVGDEWTGVISYSTAGVVTVTQNAVVAANTVNAAQVVVENISSGPPPRGSGYDDTFVANNYDIDVTGYGPNNTAVNVNSGVAKIQAKSSYY